MFPDSPAWSSGTMRHGKALATVIAVLIGICSRAGLAQESPELPAKTQTEGELAAGVTQFYKGKGPGRGNSYVERYEEDYSYLRDPNRSSDFFDPLKFIPLAADGDIYLTLNGEARFRYDNTDHRNFAVATAASPSKQPGGLPIPTPATGTSTNELYKQRYALGADLHLGPNLRFYADLYHGQQTGHDVGPTIPGNQRDALGLVNGFGEVYGIVDDAKTGFRAGRQEIFFGNDLQVRANVSTNLPSPVFDGFRVYRDWGPARIDAFAYNLVQFADGILQDRDNPHVNLWGVYGSYDLPKLAALPADERATVEPFYFGWRASPFAGGKGAGLYNDRALLTGDRIVAATGAGFIASQDHRDTFGLRAYGAIGDGDYDWQGAYQIGSYAGLRVDAFAVNTDTGYTFHAAPWKPRIGVHIDGASGGANRASGTLQTYQPMYPNTQYLAPNNEFAPTNFYDLSPRISVTPLPTVTAEYYYSWIWRYSEGDAIYIGAPWPGAQGQNSYAVTALIPGRSIGRQSDFRVTWTITPHLLALGEIGIFYPGNVLRAAGGKTTTFLDANLTFRF
ncbi:MAG: alginate export family protein [Alphaproteobacteria bacterium]|nr:alginate export family protein [Alphaproteobacteria bacterium]